MNTEEWRKANNAYLAASLEWLRLRLYRLAPEEPLVTEPVHRRQRRCLLRIR